MKPIGERLRSERLRKGVSLRAIADDLRISARYLEAIEANDWEQLPGGFFRRSFVRQYATALGLDPNVFERDLDAHRESDPEINIAAVAPPGEQQSIVVPPMPTAKRRVFDMRLAFSAAGLVAVVLASAGLLSMWQHWGDSPAAARPRLIEPSQTKTVKEPSPLTAHEVIPRPAAPPIPANQVTSNPAVTEPLETPPAFSAANPPAAVAVNMAASQPNVQVSGPVTVTLSAVEQTWIEVSSDGKLVFSGVLQPGESKAVTGTQNARMLIGNAAGLSIRFNGKAIGSVGGRGEVRRVNFTADSYQIVPLQTGSNKPQT